MGMLDIGLERLIPKSRCRLIGRHFNLLRTAKLHGAMHLNVGGPQTAQPGVFVLDAVAKTRTMRPTLIPMRVEDRRVRPIPLEESHLGRRIAGDPTNVLDLVFSASNAWRQQHACE
jgi:hypothetical protein